MRKNLLKSCRGIINYKEILFSIRRHSFTQLIRIPQRAIIPKIIRAAQHLISFKGRQGELKVRD